MKYGIWLDEWFRNYIQPSSKIKTCERYSEIIEKHLKVKLGEYELDELTPLVLQRYVTELMQSGNIVTGKGLAANSVNGIITVIQNSLKLAYTLGELKEYTADKIKRPKTKEKEVSCFTLPEQKKIEQAVLTSKKPKLFGIVLCLYSGLRIGELLALEWSDIDFNKGTITVNKTCHDGRDEKGKLCRITDTPKTTSSKRTIPIPRQLLPLLKEHKKKSNSQYVVSSDGHGIDGIIQKLYEDNVCGKINDDRFAKMSAMYEAEQEELKKTVQKLKDEIAVVREEGEEVERFMKLVDKYADITELNAEIIRTFIEKIIVYEAEKIDGVKTQRIKIIYNCIGAVRVSDCDETTPVKTDKTKLIEVA